jgi:transposase-like protein
VQANVLISHGQDIADVIRQIGVSEVTYYRWRQEYGGLKTEQVKRLKELETENISRSEGHSDKSHIQKGKSVSLLIASSPSCKLILARGC